MTYATSDNANTKYAQQYVLCPLNYELQVEVKVHVIFVNKKNAETRAL